MAGRRLLTQKQLRAKRALEPVSHPGLTFSQKHHVFIAKLKRGEMWALNYLTTAAKAAITPLFEMWPPAIPRRKKGATGPPKLPKSLTAHATDLLSMARDEWRGLPFFLDTRYIPTGGIPSSSDLKTIFDVARSMNLTAVPVTSIGFSPAYQQQIRNIIATDGRGVMIRMFLREFTDPTLVNSYLTALLGVLNVSTHQTDILIDLAFRREQIEVQTLGTTALSYLPFISGWRTVTLAAGCFPDSISNLNDSQWYPVERSDWLGWSYINSQQAAKGNRIPAYGDYGIRSGGSPRDIPNRPDPNLRYSDSQKVLVRKEPNIDGRMKTICSSLVARSEFSGAPFSRGDAEIAARAAMPGSPNNGQAEQWIQWCTNHHLELTASQIRNLP